MTKEKNINKENIANKSEQNQIKKIKSSLFTYNKNINIFSFITFIFSYMRNVWLSTVISCIIIPIVPIAIYFLTISQNVNVFGPMIPVLFILLTFNTSVIVLSSTLTFIFLEIRTSVVFKRIGLISLKPSGYVFVFILFCFISILWSHIFTFILFSIFMASKNMAISQMFNSISPMLLIFELCMLLVLSSLILIVLVLVHNRGTLNILLSIILFSFIGIFIVLLRFAMVPMSRETFRNDLYSPSGWGISIGFILLNLLLALGIWFATVKLFKWE